MKILLTTLVLFSISTPICWAKQSANIEYSQANQHYLMPESGVFGSALFAFLGLHSGLEIRFSPSLSEQKFILPASLNEAEIIRWLSHNLSTVQGFNRQQQLISLTLLPKGEYQSPELIFANDITQEGKAHQQGQTNSSAKARFQLRLQELDQAQQKQLKEQIEKNFDREQQAAARQQQRQQRKNQQLSLLVKQLQELRLEDPELYEHLLTINQNRFPALASKVLGQKSASNE